MYTRLQRCTTVLFNLWNHLSLVRIAILPTQCVWRNSHFIFCERIDQEFGCILEFIPGMGNFRYKKGWKEREEEEEKVSRCRNSEACLFALVCSVQYHSWLSLPGSAGSWHRYRGKVIPSWLEFSLGSNHEPLVKLFNLQYKFFISEINTNVTTSSEMVRAAAST